MDEIDRYDVLVIGSGEAGKYMAWTMAKAGHRTAVIERKLVGGSCPNIACLPSKNIIRSAKVASFAKRAEEFGLELGSFSVNMEGVQRRKRKMVEDLIQVHLDRYKASGAQLIMGSARFVAPRTVEVSLVGEGTRVIAGERVFLNLGTHATIPNIPGLVASEPMTHVEALNLDRLPLHLVVVGGGYVGLELAQAMRRFGSRVTVIERDPQLVSREDSDVGAALLDLFRDEGIEVLLETQIHQVQGRSGQKIRVHCQNAKGAKVIEATDVLVATGRTPNTQGIGLDKTGVELDGRGYIKVNDRLETTAPNVWAMGDCALVRNAATGQPSPPTAQYAVAQARQLADNLLRQLGGRDTRPFSYVARGMMATIGHMKGVAQIYGVSVAGLPAWLLWRAFYLSRIPTLGRKLRIFVEWTWSMFHRRLHLARKCIPLVMALPGWTSPRPSSERPKRCQASASVLDT